MSFSISLFYKKKKHNSSSEKVVLFRKKWILFSSIIIQTFVRTKNQLLILKLINNCHTFPGVCRFVYYLTVTRGSDIEPKDFLN